MLDFRLFARVTPLALALALPACDGEETTMDSGNDDAAATLCESEDRVDDFAVDLTKSGERHMVRVVAAEPAEPIRGDNTWTVQVTDADGTPLEGMTIDASPWMPDHGHGTAVEEEVVELSAGEFELSPLNLFMAGYWEVTLELTDAEGGTDEVMVAVCVE
ncbi:MAG: FixH family protein [Myxococcota bacterium]